MLTLPFYLFARHPSDHASKWETLSYHGFMPQIAYLECTRCSARTSAKSPQSLCPQCGGIIFVRYDMAASGLSVKRENILKRIDAANTTLGMWRYADVLPAVEPVTLGEGFTPLLRSRRYPGLFLKQEAANPAGNSQARGLSVAVSIARHYGLKKLAMASAGNAAVALAAYAAAAEIAAHVFMPRDAAESNYLESVAYGAKVTLVDGPISNCARTVAERKDAEGWFDVSSLVDPFRLEGDKTMGYELVEQSGWKHPDAVLYPSEGGVGLVGIWKAFEEMEALGWVNGKRPKMITVQASGGAPLDELILDIVRQSGGLALDLEDGQILASLHDWACHEGLLLSSEGAASTAAYDHLIATGRLSPEEKVVSFNTGSEFTPADGAAKDVERDHRGLALPSRYRVGGIITPQ
jgi:threonine synthase